MTREEVLEKVRKLFALAARAGTEAEAALAAERAQLLLTKYKLSAVDVMPERQEGVTEQKFDHDRKFQLWVYGLLETVAKSCYCGSFRWTGQSAYTIIGKPTDVAVAQETFVYLLTQIQRFVKQYKPTDGIGMPIIGMRLQSHRKAFAIGCAQRVRDRIWADFQAKQAPTAEAGAQVTALVVVSQQEVATYTKQNHKGLKKGHSRAQTADRFGRSYEAGKAAGDKVRLGRETRLENRSAGQIEGK